MITPMGSLMNMEYMLYGGASGWNANVPSFVNGYRANNVNFMGNYSGYPAQYNQSLYPQTVNPNSDYDSFTPQKQNTNPQQVGFGASKSDLDTLGKYYLQGMNPSESLTGAAAGGAAFALVNNTRFIAHPINSLSTIGKVEKMFAGVKDKNSKLYELWRNGDTHQLMTDAYARMHKLEGGAKSRLGMFKARIDEATYKSLKSEMEAALKSGNKEAIATATEKIRVATNAKTGWLPRGWKKITGGEVADISKKIADDAAIKAAVKENVAKKGSKTIAEQMKHGFKGQGGMGGLFFMGIEFLTDWSKIKKAFSKDNSTGVKQLGQTTIKGAGSLIGWTAGEAVGAWAGAKLGALAGTAIAPGVGTAIGAVAGLIGGSIGCALMGKLTHKIVGEDVGSKVEVEDMKKTAQGQVKLLELTMQQAQSDKKLDPKVMNALNNVANAYSQA